MPELKIIRIDAAEGLRDRVHEAAWKRHTTLSELIREGLKRYVKKGASGARLSKTDPGWGKTPLKVKVSPELWEAARQRAMEDGDSLHEVVRRQLYRICETEGT